MTVADAALVAEAVTALGLTDLGPIGATGGQKAVRLVEKGGLQSVLKVVAVNLVTPEALKRAEHEVDLLARLANPNVVSVESGLVELGIPVHGAAWVEEYLDGQDLGALVGSRHWTWTEAREMGMGVANGLAAGHAESVIHRDLSANNVRRLTSGTYKVLDFGVARHTLRTGVTVAGQPGTPGYFTPEHLNSYSGKPMKMSDVWQVGNLMYYALAGELPYPYRGDEWEYASRLHAGSMMDLATLRPDLTPQQLAVVRRAMHPQPARRFLDGAALRDELVRTP
jgi:serine/threonine protein kinase